MIIYVALFVASLVISQALQPKPQKPKPAAFQDFDFPTIEDGTPQLVVFGDVWLKDWTVLGTGNFATRAIVTKQKGLFGSKKTTTGYKYYMGIHMGICRGIDELIEVKVGEKTAWTGTVGGSLVASINIRKSNLFGGDKGEGGIDGTLTLLGGDQDQPISGLLTNLYKTSDIPAFRNVVTFFYDGHICSNSPYPKPWAFRVRRISNDWDGSVWYPSKAAIMLENNTIRAMNPAHILYEAFTNRVWGRGFAASQLDLSSFQAAADKLFDEKFGMCLAWKRQESLQEFIQQVLDVIGAALFIDRTTGLWRLTLLRDDYDVSNLTTYNSSNGLLRIESDDNAANDIATNQLIVTYRDPITNSDKTIRDENIASIQKYGVISENKSYAGIPTASLAARLAARDLKPSQAGIKKFKLVFDRRAYALQPMSVFKISSPERGIDAMVLRAIRVEHNNITNGEITVTSIQDVFGLPETSYIKDQPSLWQPPNLLAQPVTEYKIYEVPYLDLLQAFSFVEILANMQGYVGVVAQTPSTLHLDFDIYAKSSTETIYQAAGSGDYGFTSNILTPLAQTAALTECLLLNPIDEAVEIGDRAFIGDEIVKITDINRMSNTVKFQRGCLDTVPTKHDINAKFWVYSNTASAAERGFLNSQIANIKLVTRTSENELDLALATTMNLTMNNRYQRPYPPSNLRLNDISYPAQLNQPLLKIEWSERNRITQSDQVLDQLAASVSAEENTTYTLRVFKKINPMGAFVLASELTGLTVNVAYADDDAAITPGQNDFYILNQSIGRLTAIDSPHQALKTTQRLILSRPVVGQFYGLLLNPNKHGAVGFNSKYVEEEFLASDTTITFLNRLRSKIVSNLSSSDKTSLKYGLFHSLTGGWRCEGVSGRVLEISHTVLGQSAGNIIHFVLYASNGDVLFHHQFSNAYLGDLYFDSSLERCFIYLSYNGTKDLNNSIATNNPNLRAFTFDDFTNDGISFKRTPSTVPECLHGNNFSYANGVLWTAIPSADRKSPLILTRLNIETLELLTSVNYTNPEVTSTTPLSNTINSDADIGKLILTDTEMYYVEDRYRDARYPNNIAYLPMRSARFNRNSGAYIDSVLINSEIASDIAIAQARELYGSVYYTLNGRSIATAPNFSIPPQATDKFKNIVYSYLNGQISSRIEIQYNANARFALAVSNRTGVYQFSTAILKTYSAPFQYRTDFIVDTRNLSFVNYADAILVKSATVSAAPEYNKVGFPDAASLDIELDIVGAFYFETTSSAEAGSGPGGSTLFADVSDAVAVRVELWSIRDGLPSFQKQIVEVPIIQD